MNEMSLEALIVQLAASGISGANLRSGVLLENPSCTDGQLFSALLGLQDRKQLVAEVVDGIWVYTSIDPSEAQQPECSPAFAEMLHAADCDEWTEINVDEFLDLLDSMIAEAKAQQKPT